MSRWQPITRGEWDDKQLAAATAVDELSLGGSAFCSNLDDAGQLVAFTHVFRDGRRTYAISYRHADGDAVIARRRPARLRRMRRRARGAS